MFVSLTIFLGFSGAKSMKKTQLNNLHNNYKSELLVPQPIFSLKNLIEERKIKNRIN